MKAFVLLLTLLFALPARAHDFTTGNGNSPGGPGDPDNQDGCPWGGSGADPVLLFRGDFSEDRVDVSLPGRTFDLNLVFSYRSRSAYQGPFGYGWDFAYNRRLRRLDNNDIELRIGQNRSEPFAWQAGTMSYANPMHFSGSMVANGDGTHTLTSQSGMRQEFDIDGNLVSLSDRSGNTLAFTYTPAPVPILGNSAFFVAQTTGVVAREYLVTRIVDSVGRIVDFSYDASGHLERIDYAGRSVHYAYDAQYRLTSVTSPATAQFPSGRTTTYVYDANHNLVSIVDPKGQTYISNVYDAGDRIATQTLGGGTYQFAYSTGAGGVAVTTVTDPVGTVTRYTFDATGHMTLKEVVTDGQPTGEPGLYMTSFTYDGGGNLLREVHPRGNATEYTYNSRGQILTTRRKDIGQPAFTPAPSDLVTTFVYDAVYGELKQVVDAAGRSTTYTFDYELSEPARGLMRKVTRPQVGGTPNEIELTYNSFGQVETLRDPNGIMQRFVYDPASGLPAQITEAFGTPLAATTHLTYDDIGNITSVTDARGNTTTVQYDEEGRRIRETLPAPYSYQTHYRYDANGLLAQTDAQAVATGPGTVPPLGTTNPLDGWQSTVFTYTALDRPEGVRDDLGVTTSNAYDAIGRRTAMTDANGNAVTFAYDERGLLWQVTNGAGTASYVHDGNRNLISVSDPQGRTTNYTYDGFDRLTRVTYPDSTFEQFAYDELSNLISRTLPSGATIQYAYDALNRISTKTTASEIASFTFDPGGRLTAAVDADASVGFAYDALGRIVSTTTSLTGLSTPFVQTYGFDPVGNRTTTTYPDATVLNSTFDQLNRLSRISIGTPPPGGGLSTGSLVEYGYDSLHRRVSKTLANQVATTTTIDGAGRITGMTTNRRPASIEQITYTYDSSVNRSTRTDSAGVQGYGYDGIDQLTSVDYPSGYGFDDIGFTYDASGNRSSMTVGGTPTSYSTNALNQYTNVGGASVGYDANGNLSSLGATTFAYDEEAAMTTASGPFGTESFGYDALGRRVRRTLNGVTSFYLYDAADLTHELDAGGAVTAVYVYGADVDEPVARVAGGQAFYYVSDAMGSTTHLTDSLGEVVESYRYDAFGTPLFFDALGASLAQSAVGNRLLYTGREWDAATGLVHLRTRDMSPALGRFLQRDPLGLVPDENPYRYVANNPLWYVDPWGLSKGVGQPGFAEGLIPIWGSGRAAVDDFQNGRWGWGVFNTVMAVTDVIPVRALIGAGVKTGARLVGRGSTQFARRAGQAGMRSAGIAQNTRRIDSITGTAKYRVPDGLDLERRVLTEVKNATELRSRDLKQIQDFLQYSQREGMRFDLQVPRDLDFSSVPQWLRDAIRNGDVNLRYLDTAPDWADAARKAGASAAGDVANGLRDEDEPGCDSED